MPALELFKLLAERIRPEHLLQSPARARILLAVHERPGISIGALSKRLSMNVVTLHYHVERLREGGYVRAERAGRRRLVFSASAPAYASPEERAMLLERTARRIALAVVHRRYRSVLELVEDLGESPRVVYYHLKRLREAGLVTGPDGAHGHGIGPTAKLLALLGEG